MKTEWDDATLEQWLNQFKKAAILFHRGQYLAVKAIEKAGADACNALVREIVSGHVRGRDVLLPLLHDKEPYVQVSAAQYLVTEHPEIVVPILEYLEEHDTTGADFTAQCTLWLHEDGWYLSEAGQKALAGDC
jgi:hypothetical protein